jgi:hypothetical protein
VKNIKTGEVTDLPVSGLFFAIGHEPATRFLDGQVGAPGAHRGSGHQEQLDGQGGPSRMQVCRHGVEGNSALFFDTPPPPHPHPWGNPLCCSWSWTRTATL